jgi:putative hydrolase of the HAD superfamily
MIKAVLYDLGDIFFEAHYWRKWMWETLSRIGKYNNSFKCFYELYESYLQPVYENKKEYWDTYNDFLNQFNLQDKNEFIKLSRMQKAFYEKNRVLYNSVKETLEQLQQKGIKNVLITDNENGADWVRNNILLRFEINQFIDLVITSKEAEVTKPNSKIFMVALNKLNLKKEEVIFIAHDKDEIDGAINIGITTVELNNYLNVRTNAEYRIKNISNLKQFLS